jgi:hypothetical protein
VTTRPFSELSAFECVLAVADRYDVEVTLLPTRGLWKKPRGATPGPMGHFADVRRRKVYVESAVSDPLRVASEFHEVVHCIVTPAPKNFLEHHGLLQFETQLAREVFAHRPEQIEDVRGYQSITAVNRDHKVGDWPDFENTVWWRIGLDFMREIGFLDDNFRPTWQRGKFPSDRVMSALRKKSDKALIDGHPHRAPPTGGR